MPERRDDLASSRSALSWATTAVSSCSVSPCAEQLPLELEKYSPWPQRASLSFLAGNHWRIHHITTMKFVSWEPAMVAIRQIKDPNVDGLDIAFKKFLDSSCNQQSSTASASVQLQYHSRLSEGSTFASSLASF